MEPVWLGLAAPSILSSAGNLARAATRPFAAALERAAGLLEERSEESAHGAQGIEIDEARARAEELAGDLHWRIHEALRDAGITLDEPVQLRISPTDGELEIVGDTPQRAMIEAALAGDPKISDEFRQLATLRALVATAGSDGQDLVAILSDEELRFA